MNLTIVVADNAVTKDGVGHGGLDLSTCSIPTNVWALQWHGTSGHIEYTGTVPNDEITELPAWAEAAEVLWQKAEDKPAPTPIPDQLGDWWSEYPECDVHAFETLQALMMTGVRVIPAYPNMDAAGELKGSKTLQVSPGATGLRGLERLRDYCIEHGIASFSDIIYPEEVDPGLITYLENLGYVMGDITINQRAALVARLPWNLDMHKNRKKQIINSERTASIDAGYDDGTNVWDIDKESMVAMTAKVVTVEDADSVEWRSKANDTVTMTGAEFKTLETNIVAHIDTLYANSWTRKDAVNACTTMAEVDAI
jgi:hypothetical protein